MPDHISLSSALAELIERKSRGQVSDDVLSAATVVLIAYQMLQQEPGSEACLLRIEQEARGLLRRHLGGYRDTPT